MTHSTWRLIINGKGSAAFNMALDESIALSVRKSHFPSTIRFYEWDRLAVSLGYFQNSHDINSEYCQMKGIPVVRRMTGGRAVLHGQDLTYSFCAGPGETQFGRGISENYQKLSTAFLSGFRKLGLNAVMTERKAKRDALKNPSCFKAVSLAELTVSGKKIVGSAQKRWSDGMLQQGSIMVDFDPHIMCKIFYHKNIDMINDIGRIKDFNSTAAIPHIRNALIKGFEEVFQIKLVEADPDNNEYDMAKKLEIEKYSSPHWNLTRGSKDDGKMK